MGKEMDVVGQGYESQYDTIINNCMRFSTLEVDRV